MKAQELTKRSGAGASAGVLVLLLLLLPAVAAQPNTIGGLVANVSQAQIAGHIQALENIGPRSTPATQAMAAAYITSSLSSYGYSVTQQPAGTSVNVIARLNGLVTPSRVFVIGAHFDTVPNSPGADDNASGVAGMLEIARVLAGANVASSIEFVAFALEEAGFQGSTTYVQQAVATGQNIIGMVSLEMIGYTCAVPGCQTPFFNIPGCLTVSTPGVTLGTYIAAVANTASATLLPRFATAAARYVAPLTTLTGEVAGVGLCFPDTRRSDHRVFWDAGFKAMMITDTSNFRNPNYHLPTDTLSTLDLQFARRVTQAVLAMVVDGQPNSPAAALSINGVGVSTENGPFKVTIPASGGPQTLSWSGPPGQPYALFAASSNPSNTFLGCTGMVDIGTPPLYLDVLWILDGTASPVYSLNGSGSAVLPISVPATPPGYLVSLQGVVIQPTAPCALVLTAAFDVWSL